MPSPTKKRRVRRRTPEGNLVQNDGSNLIVRKNDVLCTICFQTLPIHSGESGVPLPSFLHALNRAREMHPNRPHDKVF